MKPVQGREQKLVTIWLYWTPEQPMPTPDTAPKAPPTPTPRKTIKKEKVVVKEEIVKKEDKVKCEPGTPTPAKRPRASTTTAVTRVTRRQTRALPQEESEAEEEVEDGYALLKRSVARARRGEVRGEARDEIGAEVEDGEVGDSQVA
jgi:hypothetical protein